MTRRHNLRTLDALLACLLVRDCVALCLRRLQLRRSTISHSWLRCMFFEVSSLRPFVLLSVVWFCSVPGVGRWLRCPSVCWLVSVLFCLLVVVSVLFCCCSGLLDRTASTSTYHACTCDAPGSRCFAWYRITFRTTRLFQPGLSSGCWPFVFRCWLC